MVVGISDGTDFRCVLVSGKPEVGLYVFTAELTPFGVDFLLGIEGIGISLCKGHVGKKELVLCIFLFVFDCLVFDYLLYKAGLTESEVVAGYGIAVFGVFVGFILTAVKNKCPDRSEVYGIVGPSSACGSIIRKHFRTLTAKVVVASWGTYPLLYYLRYGKVS